MIPIGKSDYRNAVNIVEKNINKKTGLADYDVLQRECECKWLSVENFASELNQYNINENMGDKMLHAVIINGKEHVTNREPSASTNVARKIEKENERYENYNYGAQAVYAMMRRRDNEFDITEISPFEVSALIIGGYFKKSDVDNHIKNVILEVAKNSNKHNVAIDVYKKIKDKSTYSEKYLHSYFSGLAAREKYKCIHDFDDEEYDIFENDSDVDLCDYVLSVFFKNDIFKLSTNSIRCSEYNVSLVDPNGENITNNTFEEAAVNILRMSGPVCAYSLVIHILRTCEKEINVSDFLNFRPIFRETMESYSVMDRICDGYKRTKRYENICEAICKRINKTIEADEEITKALKLV